MDLNEVYNFLQFHINKYTGSWFSPPELDILTDKGQLSYYKECFIKYGTGQRLTDALAPFKVVAPFTTNSTGLLSVPDNYMDLIDIIPIVGGKRVTCPIINEDEITNRLNSQVIPNSTSKPFAEVTANWDYQLYPQVQQSGLLSYFMRPPKPFFKYTTVSQRVIVYDAVNSTQLLWGDDEIYPCLIHVLETMGINLDDNDLVLWSNNKTKENLLSVVKT